MKRELSNRYESDMKEAVAGGRAMINQVLRDKAAAILQAMVTEATEALAQVKR